MQVKLLFKSGGVFILFYFIFFGWQMFVPYLMSTDDPYYHAKHSALIAASGDVTFVGQWAPTHFLTTAPTDPWWLYHVITAGFIKVFGLLVGVKIWAAFAAAFVFASAYFIFNRLNITYAFVWMFFLFVASSIFTARLTLERPFVISIPFFFLGYYFLYQRRYFWLFIATALYVLTYNLAPIILLLVAVFLAVDFYFSRTLNLKPSIAVLGGIAAGIILHPHPLNYIYVMSVHLVKVFYYLLSGVNLNTGAEIQLHGIADFLEGNFLIALFYILALAVFFKLWSDKKVNRLSLSLFLASISWFPVALLIPRGTEYWLPLAVLFIAYNFQALRQSADWPIFQTQLRQKITPSLLSFFILSAVAMFAAYNIFTVFMFVYERRQDTSDYYFQGANDWLMHNTPRDSVVFYPIWSMFPQMFFYNNHNRYLTAFGPEFLYEYNPAVYYTWANIAYRGVYCPHELPCLEFSPRREIRGVKFALKNILNAPTAILPNQPDSWVYKVFSTLTGDFIKVYENKELVIFKVKE